MKVIYCSLILTLCSLEFGCADQPYTRKVENEKIQRVVSKVMEEKATAQTSRVSQDDLTKEFEIFLGQLDAQSQQQAAALQQLGHLFMIMEEEQIRQNPGLLFQRDAHRFSIGIYERIRSQYPLTPGMDKVLYQLAHGYYEENQKEKALATLHELATRFSKSGFYPETSFRIGEIYFDEGKYPEASEAYFKALEANPGRPLTEKISYKMTWAYFKMGNYQKTINQAVNTLNRYTSKKTDGTTLLDIESLSEPTWDQVKELLHLAVLSFDFWGGVSKTRNYFDFHGHVSYENLIYRPLGHLYLNRGKFQEAALAFETFLSLYPTHEEAPNFQMDLIETYRKAEKWDYVKRAGMAFIENYKPEGAWWNGNNASAHAKIKLLRKDLLFQQAQAYHAEAQQNKKKDDYLLAIRSYQAFLREFPGEREAPRIEYFLGEAFFETGQFEQAAVEYETAAYQYPLHTYSEEAALAALISHEKILSREHEKNDTLNLNFLKSCQSFLKAFPGSDKKFNVLVKAMTLSFQSGRPLEGRVFAQQVLTAPLEKAGVNSQVQAHYLTGKSYFEERNYDKAEMEFKEAMRWTSRADYHDPEGPGAKTLKTFLASIQFKKAEILKNSLKWAEAAAAFYHIYEEFPDGEIALASLMNSGSAFLEVKDYPSAEKAFLAVRDQYPQSSFVTEAKTALANLFERENKWKEAAQEYEFLIKNARLPDQKNRLADKLYTLYFRASDWADLYQTLERDNKTKSIDNFKWLYFYAAAAMNLKKEKDAFSAIENNLTAFNKKNDHDPEEEEWVMKSALLKGEMLAIQFGSILLADPLQKSLPLKKEKLKEAMEAFSTAAQSRQLEISSEAIYHIGNLFEQFADDLIHSERPKDLNAEQNEIYEQLLRNQIDPLYRKAVEVYQKNVTLKFQGDNDWIKKSADRLSRLQAEGKG
ncbi:MAG: tetratricopeptide repeat protein [Nitrospirae bacterium]|nr:tetratricopeptide repeat protein [Nitrospirota bacterium]MBI3351571.1 tetratricopeptide repeat protein [Nitrospirota bacterium]